MRTTAAILLSTLAFLLCGPVYPQAGQLRALAIRYQEDRERLKRYNWKSRTEIAIDGQTKQLSLFAVSHDTEGHRQQAPIKDERKKYKKAAKFIEDLRDLVSSYTRFTPKEMYTVFGGAKVFSGQGEAQDLLRVQVRGVVRPGDSMYMWADTFNHRLRKIEINTSLDGQPVNVVTQFRDLEDGPTYAARMIVKTELKRKPTIITTENFDHVRRDE